MAVTFGGGLGLYSSQTFGSFLVQPYIWSLFGHNLFLEPFHTCRMSIPYNKKYWLLFVVDWEKWHSSTITISKKYNWIGYFDCGWWMYFAAVLQDTRSTFTKNCYKTKIQVALDFEQGKQASILLLLGATVGLKLIFVQKVKFGYLVT